MESQTHETTSTRFAVRPFRIDIPEEAIADLRRRITATVWPDKETVADASQGVQLATMQALARYWGTTTTSGGSRRSSMPCRSS
jgi:Epoxide hydrolase N terminus